MKKTDNELEIIIPIEKSTNATNRFNPNNLLQQESLIKIKSLLKKNLMFAKLYKSEHFDRCHNAITILGERGTGKTSFLLNLERSFDLNKYEESEIYEQLEFLDSLDPTLFEDKQNILVSIISVIADKINKDEKIINKKDWLTCLTELSDGLSLLDGIGSNFMEKDIWDDSRIILDNGLVSASSGLKFEQKFHSFIEKSLELLDKKEIFVLRFDDIDTSVLKGWPVLEVIRKYLTTPRIQIIISGDIHLFSKLVRLKQWENLEKLTEFEDKTTLIPTIDQLEEQYLTKILKPENRIYLQSLESILKRHPNSINVEYNKKSTLIETIYNNIAEEIFILKQNTDKEVFINILLKLPIRTNIQILMVYFSSMDNNNINTKKFLDDFALIFMINFSKFNFKYEDTFLLTEDKNTVVNYVIEKLNYIKGHNNLKSLTALKFLRPIFEDKDINLFILYLNAHVIYSMKNSISVIFDWYLKKYYFFKIIENANINEDIFLSYFNFKDPLSLFASKINSAIFSSTKRINGFAKVYRQKRQAVKYGFSDAFDSYEVKIKENLEESYPNNYLTVLLINTILFNKIKIKDSSEIYLNVSLLNIFSFLGELLTLNKSTFDSNFNNLVIDKTLEELSETKKLNDNYDKSTDEVYNKLTNDFSKLQLYKELKDWVNLKNEVVPFSVQLVEELWDAFFIRESNMEVVNNVAEYLELQIFIFFNSIYRTIQKHYNPSISTSYIRSYKDARKRFNGNIKNTKYERLVNSQTFDFKKEKLKSIDFLEFMLICPMWKYLINYPSNTDFVYSLGSSNNLNSINDYIKLLPIHQGATEDSDLTVAYDDESSWPKGRSLTPQKVKKCIEDNSLDINKEDIEDRIWDILKYKDKIRGTLDQGNRRKLMQDGINLFKSKNDD